MEQVGPVFALILVVFGIILAVAWIILPFALIGTKPLLRELIAETKKTNELLRQRVSISSANEGDFPSVTTY